MSHSVDECYAFYNENRVKARKEHQCCACKETIHARTTYWVISWVFEGVAESVKRCERCQAIHIHLRKRCADSGSDMWPNERLACGLTYEGEWGELPEHIAALAFALPSEVIAPQPPR